MRKLKLNTRENRRSLGRGGGEILALSPGRARVKGSGNELTVCAQNLKFEHSLTEPDVLRQTLGLCSMGLRVQSNSNHLILTMT
jgi:hypothetical protein